MGIWLEVKSKVAIVPARSVSEVVGVMVVFSRAVIRDSFFVFLVLRIIKNEERRTF
jgi:hypothetical protein